MKRSGLSLALGAAFAVGTVAVAAGASWDERIFSSHVDFDAVAQAGESAIPALIARGKELFKAKFTLEDGAGRPKATQAIIPTKRKRGINPAFSRTSGPDSNSCSGCHNDPITGGSGDTVANAFVSEGFESAEFDNTDPTFSSERHTVALMGAGLVELLAREMTADLQAARNDAVKRAWAGGKEVTCRPRVERRAVRLDRRASRRHRRPRPHRRRRRRPHRAPVQPQGRVRLAAPVHDQRDEHPSRHGGGGAVRGALDGSHDFAESGVPDAVTPGDISALVAFQASLPPPTVKQRPAGGLAHRRGRGRQAIRRRWAAPVAISRRCR